MLECAERCVLAAVKPPWHRTLSPCLFVCVESAKSVFSPHLYRIARLQS